MTDKQNIAKDIVSAVHFEEELQLSWKEGGITVVDVYSTCWGPCKAIAATFRRLYFEADESLKLKFLTVDATLCLQELENSNEDHLPRREFQRPRNTDAIKDTMPSAWRQLLKKQNGHSKPLFLFYKEGRFIRSIEGVNTPEICGTIKDLTTVKTPADEFITNAQLLEVWSEHFNPNESEVQWEKFALALNAICKLTVPLTDEEMNAVKTALNVTNNRTLSAEELQKWVGTGTIMQAFTALLPNYEDRAIQVRLEQEGNRRANANSTAASEDDDGDESRQPGLTKSGSVTSTDNDTRPTSAPEDE